MGNLGLILTVAGIGVAGFVLYQMFFNPNKKLGEDIENSLHNKDFVQNIKTIESDILHHGSQPLTVKANLGHYLQA